MAIVIENRSTHLAGRHRGRGGRSVWLAVGLLAANIAGAGPVAAEDTTPTVSCAITATQAGNGSGGGTVPAHVVVRDCTWTGDVTSLRVEQVQAAEDGTDNIASIATVAAVSGTAYDARVLLADGASRLRVVAEPTGAISAEVPLTLIDDGLCEYGARRSLDTLTYVATPCASMASMVITVTGPRTHKVLRTGPAAGSVRTSVRFTPTVRGTYAFTVTGTTASDAPEPNKAVRHVNSFVLTVGPVITLRSPAAGATNVSTRVTVGVVFDRKVTGAKTRVHVRDLATGKLVQTQVMMPPCRSEIFLRSTRLLARNHWYRIEIAAGISDAKGHRMAAARWEFKTR
jgi:hypothetical protein